jgi:endonuclease/exonuclease/phosphatase family metal-dependent hydrolase
VLFSTVAKDDIPYRIATTHFTWSEKGRATDTQREHLHSLLSALETEKELVLCGDFNMPRGGELFSTLAERYKDTIPPEYVTSIDVSLHRNRLDDPEELSQKMVDGLFTTPEYLAQNVRLVSGLSDHMAITATILIQNELS